MHSPTDTRRTPQVIPYLSILFGTRTTRLYSVIKIIFSEAKDLEDGRTLSGSLGIPSLPSTFLVNQSNRNNAQLSITAFAYFCVHGSGTPVDLRSKVCMFSCRFFGTQTGEWLLYVNLPAADSQMNKYMQC